MRIALVVTLAAALALVALPLSTTVAEARPDPPQCGTLVPCCDLPLCLNPDDPCRPVLYRDLC